MTLTLAVETSSRTYGVALAEDDRLLAHRSRERDSDGYPGIGGAVLELLESCGSAVRELDRLAVDVGPGNLGSVRVGVAYVNGLAFARSLPIVSADALTLLARGASEAAAGRPVLVLRPAGGGQVFAGWFPATGDPVRRYGPLTTVVPDLVAGRTELVTAGSLGERVPDLVPGATVESSGVLVPRVQDLMAVATSRSSDAVPVVSPLTEEIAPARD